MQAAYGRRYRELWDGHWWWRSRETLLIDEVAAIARTTRVDRLLDVGCGDGLFFEALGRFGSVDGLEPDASLLTDSAGRPRIKVGSLDATYRAERPYDLVLLLDVLEHIEDDRAALASALAATRPGGAILLTVPALPSLWSRHDVANQHFRRYTPRTLRRVILSAGYVEPRLRYAFAWTVAPMLARRWLAPPGRSDYDVAIPPRPINRALTAWSRLEHAVGRHLRWPLGSSLIAVARRPS